MIQINLLPAEYRKAEATPIGRFIAIVAGAVLVTGGLVAYGFVHYSTLKGVREVREATEAEYQNKKAQADVSLALQAEISAYEGRRKAIQQVAKDRILHSRKLDEFLDIIYNKGERTSYFVWLKDLSAKPGRAVRKGVPETGGTVSFSGWAETREFSRVTNLRDSIRKDPYFQDFKSISPPVFKEVRWDDGLEPSAAGRFNYTMVLKPLGWQHDVKKK
ncbi:MAG: hypothetical protein HC813_00670 [Planctomycetes bacterium]|nr:hypothetical protein [Planctomycetota bacterium]